MPVTSVSFTSGEIFDIIFALADKCQTAENDGDHQLAAYYLNLVQQFEEIVYKLKDLPGEDRVAHLVMAR